MNSVCQKLVHILKPIVIFIDFEEGKKLLKTIAEACSLLSEYNKRLSSELSDRQIVQKKLAEYTAYQKYNLAATEDRLEVRFFPTLFFWSVMKG